MHRYSTPYHRFTLPISLSHISEVYITYAQYGEVLVEKTLADCIIISDTVILTHLSQEDTMKFREVDHHGARLDLQMTILTKGGNRIPSDTVKVKVEDVLKEGVI